MLGNSLKISLIIFIFNSTYFFFNLNLDNKLKNLQTSNFIEKNYKFPKFEKIKENKKKDLLLIYLESFDEKYSFKNDLSNETLNQLNFKNITSKKVNNFYQTTYNNYTIGAIVSSQCGVPQKPIGILDPRFRERGGSHLVDVFGLKNFLPNAVCLGDLLKFNKYENIFMNSINPEFQAMSIFFGDHNYDKIIGKDYFINKGIDNFDSWAEGVSDRILFLEAEKIIDKMKSENKNFNLTILTADTHFPGYIDKDCTLTKNLKKKDINLSISCTSMYLYNLIENVKKKYNESINIVIVGDHLYPIPNKEIDNSKEESIYNRILNSNIKIHRNEMNHYDLYPTILDLMNYPYEYKVGLGYSVLRDYKKLDYKEYKKELIEEIEKKSEFYYEFWKK